MYKNCIGTQLYFSVCRVPASLILLYRKYLLATLHGNSWLTPALKAVFLLVAVLHYLVCFGAAQHLSTLPLEVLKHFGRKQSPSPAIKVGKVRHCLLGLPCISVSTNQKLPPHM